MATSITAYEISKEVYTALKADSGLALYFSSNFAQSPTYKLGEDNRDPNGRKDCPFVSVTPSQSNIGMTDGIHSWEIIIQVGIIKDEYIAGEMSGVLLMEQLFGEIRRVVENIPSNLVADRIDFNPVHGEYYPMHLGLVTLQYQISNVLSGTVTFN